MIIVTGKQHNDGQVVFITDKQYKDVCRIVGKNFAKQRKLNEMTQMEVAFQLETAQSYVSGVELGKHIPSGKQLLRFSKLYGCSVSAFFEGIDEVLPRRVLNGYTA